MNSVLSKNYRLITFFVLALIFAGIYTYTFKLSSDSRPGTESATEVPEAYFVPPENTVKEVTVRGKVVRIGGDSGNDATHEIVDGNGNRIVYAVTSDDKLRQQEDNVVTLVGEIPIASKVSPDVVLDVQYISFK